MILIHEHDRVTFRRKRATIVGRITRIEGQAVHLRVDPKVYDYLPGPCVTIPASDVLAVVGS